ncbi:hypothetical protein LXL04_028166 [Taraxacum kok-saghyz]
MASSSNPHPCDASASMQEDLKFLCASNTSVCNFVSVKLSSERNYHLWKTQMLCLMKSHNMVGLVDDTVFGPRVSSMEMKFQYDNLLKGWIFGSVSENVLDAVVDLFSAKDVWDKLNSFYDVTTTPQQDRNFFWGILMGERGINWINWDKVCSRTESGGLGVIRLEHVNFSLLSKWIWRFKMEEDALWVKIIKCLHGDKGHTDVTNRESSWNGCWKNILLHTRKLNQFGLNPVNLMQVKVHNGVDTELWNERWNEGVTLSGLFPRLFALETCKQATLADRIGLGLDCWPWRRAVRDGREKEEARALAVLLADVRLTQGGDRWVVKNGPNERFSTSWFRRLVEDADCHITGSSNLWIKWIPIKSNVFIWRLALNRLPVESLDHLFLNCDRSSTIWTAIASWIHTPFPNWGSVRDILLWPDSLNNNNKRTMKLIKVICYATLKVIWSSRNEMAFLQKKPKTQEAVIRIKETSFLWCSSRNAVTIETSCGNVILRDIEANDNDPETSTQGLQKEECEKLYKATVKGDWDEVESILKNNEDAVREAITNDGSTILHIAVGIGQNDIVKNLFSYITEDDILNVRSSDGSTALHIAAIVGNTFAVDLLVEKSRALLQIEDNKGKKPLHKAYENMHLDTIGKLFKATNGGGGTNTFSLPLLDVAHPGVEIGVDLLVNAISAKEYFLALELIEKFPKLAVKNDAVLMAIAKTFPTELDRVERTIHPFFSNIWERICYASSFIIEVSLFIPMLLLYYLSVPVKWIPKVVIGPLYVVVTTVPYGYIFLIWASNSGRQPGENPPRVLQPGVELLTFTHMRPINPVPLSS